VLGNAIRRNLPTRSAGGKSSANIRKLNPVFQAWLMGWLPGLTRFDWEATEWSRWLRLLRSVVSYLACPTDARRCPRNDDLTAGGMAGPATTKEGTRP
jgi:hypothetical protein